MTGRGGVKEPRRPLDRYRFLTRKCRSWLPCDVSDDEWHTHHLALIVPPIRKSRR